MAVIESGHLASREVDDLYRRHDAEVYRYAYAVLGNRADAEDVTQTTFLNAYRSLEQGVRPRKPSNWLLTIASNAIKQRFRQDQARPRLVELDDRIAGHEADDDGPTVGEVLAALSKIPPQQRQAIILREFEGRSYTEIAEIIGVTTSALETLLFRARRSLAEELEHQLTCTEAQLAISKSVDDRLGRKERRRLRDHLNECPDCAHFARLQQHNRMALRGLMLIPIPLSLSIVKGLEGAGTASAATVPFAASAGGVAASVGASAGVGAGAGAGVGAGVGAGAGAGAGGGLFAGGVTLKAAAAVAAVTVAGGAAVTGTEIATNHKTKAPPAATKPGERLGQVAPRGVSVPGNGVARGKPTAPGQVKKGASSAEHGSPRVKANIRKTHPTKPSHPPNTNNGTRVAGTKRSNTTRPANSTKTTSTTTASPTGKGNGTASTGDKAARAESPSSNEKPAHDNGGGKKP